MVMADRQSEELRNGRRSRGPSPNGNFNDDDSSAAEDSDQDNGMRIGEEFQANIVQYNPDAYKQESRPEGAMLVWSPNQDVLDSKVDEYIHIAKEKHGYNTEQALGMLFWHKHVVDKALADLANFTPFPDEWTVEDKVLFEQAFSFHGKSFHRIRQMLPDKSIASLVKYYYSWKKTRSRTSLMDRQARKLANHRDDSDEDLGSSSDSDFEKNKENGKTTVSADGKTICTNCEITCTQLHSTPKGNLCSSCYQYWRRTGVMRTAMGKRDLQSRHHPYKNKRKPPRGMYLEQDDLIALATGPAGQGDALLKNLEAELVSLKRQVQNNKQMLSLQKHKTIGGIDDLRIPEGNQRINARWTNEELLLAVQGVRKYGKNFRAIAETIGNKTEAHVRTFFINFRRRYNLDEVLAEYEKEHGSDGTKYEEDLNGVEEKMELEDDKQTAPSVGPNVGAPPPLLKQGQSPVKSTYLQQPARSNNRPILQQPPPLIRPSNTTPVPPKPPKLTSVDKD
ncbi:REST corepressor 3 [Lingula anatina]|uniref:REST corepressor 3 n=1 Tax=Lingula anatina TaxID=7574 RepID=A0A1S3IUM9_LINAN|nr:REST corepressor 3 [Lingula anatina]|eukprot:XP_013401912.1 REST corepressor 3 [Lingula anatina]